MKAVDSSETLVRLLGYTALNIARETAVYLTRPTHSCPGDRKHLTDP
jgi:hypothetical protein